MIVPIVPGLGAHPWIYVNTVGIIEDVKVNTPAKYEKNNFYIQGLPNMLLNVEFYLYHIVPNQLFWISKGWKL